MIYHKAKTAISIISGSIKAGESEIRIYMLPLWKTVPHFYSEEELVILQMTEEITFICNGLSGETCNKATIAKVGYETEKDKTDANAYKALPSCYKYK